MNAGESYWRVELSNLQRSIADRHDALVSELAKATEENLGLLKKIGKKDNKISRLEDQIRLREQDIEAKESELAAALKKIVSSLFSQYAPFNSLPE